MEYKMSFIKKIAEHDILDSSVEFDEDVSFSDLDSGDVAGTDEYFEELPFSEHDSELDEFELSDSMSDSSFDGEDYFDLPSDDEDVASEVTFESDMDSFDEDFSDETSFAESAGEEHQSADEDETSFDEFDIHSHDDGFAMEDDGLNEFSLPGAENYVEDKKVEKETNWKDDKDVTKFMAHIKEMYPSKIPKHDGKQVVGCDRAITFLKGILSEITQAIKLDNEFVLPVEDLESLRQRVSGDIAKLSAHKKKLLTQKKASEEADEIRKRAELIKEATVPKIQLVMTPFERAITGIVINSVVSAGKPFEDVFEYLSKKYKLDDREKLSMLQLIMDMGFPIYKDRGTIGDEGGEDGEGIEFIKSYLA
jgi:hypothetical protein